MAMTTRCLIPPESCCTIEFFFDGEKYEIKTENARMYLGARAYFDGTYFRRGPIE